MGMSNTLPSRREVARAAWFEYKVTKAAAGLATEAMLGAEEPPAEFVDVELGFALGEGPSLMATLDDVAHAAARGMRLYGDHTLGPIELPAAPEPKPVRKRRPRATAEERRERLRALLKVA